MANEASSPRRKLSAIVMVDVSGFSRMMGRDEEGTTARIQEFQLRIRSIVESYEGRIVGTAGDSAFGEFDSVVNAVRCAQAIQSAQVADNTNRPPEEQIQTRIGVHLGDVIVQDYQVYGDGVNIAARLQSLADPGGICISEAVYQQVFQKLGLTFEDLGIQKLKNIEYPIRLYRVVLEGETRPKEPVRKGLQTLGPVQPVPPIGSWMEAFLTRGGLIPVALGLCLLTAPLGLFPFPQRGIAPTLGAILIGVGFGNIWARRTGRRGHFLITLGVGIALGAAFLRWSGLPNWPFIVVGLIIIINGLRSLYTVHSPVSLSEARRARREARRARRDARRAHRPLR